MMDVGKSLNPMVDIGQVEGAFVQAVGWMTSEDIQYRQKDELDDEGNVLHRKGSFVNNSMHKYIIPCARDIPRDFRVHL